MIGQKKWPFLKVCKSCIYDIGRGSIHQNVQLFIRCTSGILNVTISKYSLHKIRETILHQNTHQFKHHIQLLHTLHFSSKLTVSADYQHINNNSTCILCTLNIIAALFSSQSATPSIASSSSVSEPAV